MSLTHLMTSMMGAAGLGTDPAAWQAGYGAVVLAMGSYAWMLRRQVRLQAAHRTRERQMREEVEAYSRLDATLAQGVEGRIDQVSAAKALAVRVCRTVAEKSSFRRVMVLLRDAEGSLRCTGSIGVDDLTVSAVERWAEQVVKEEREGSLKTSALLGRGEAKSVPINLGEWQHFDREISSWEMSGKKERRRWRRAIVLPVWTGARAEDGKRLAGAIVVCSDGLALSAAGAQVTVEGLMSPLETLAGMMGTAMDTDAISERLQRAEKLAGPAPSEDDVAAPQNQPPTAVLVNFPRGPVIRDEQLSLNRSPKSTHG